MFWKCFEKGEEDDGERSEGSGYNMRRKREVKRGGLGCIEVGERG
jgi:hypothetical protein